MELKKVLKATRAELRKFGIAFCIIFFLVAGYFYLKGSEQWLLNLFASIFFLFLAYVTPLVLRPAYVVWMTLAFLLAWINTRIILGILFYLIFTPMGLVIRLFGKDLLATKIDRNAKTYWMKRSSITMDKNRYEQMF